jgi:hypothetical protein
MSLSVRSNPFVPAWQREAESRAGVEALDLLHAERDKVVGELAPLRAIYGAFGVADHLRKIELARTRQIVQARAVLDGKKVTQDDLDMMARLHNDYVGYIAEMTTGRTRWVQLEERLTAIDQRFQRSQALVRYVTSEART